MATNPPFPLSVVITRSTLPANPFEESDGVMQVIYDGVCDKQVNRFPIIKSGVQVGKYKLYLPTRGIIFKAGDEIALNELGEIIKGRITDKDVTNMGTTIFWDYIQN